MIRLNEWRSMWPVRRIRANRIAIPMVWRAVRIWFADRKTIGEVCQEHYPKDLDQIAAILNERPDFGGGSLSFLLPNSPVNHSLELQITLDFGWHGFYATWMWNRLNHVARLGLGIGSVRLMFWCPVYTIKPTTVYPTPFAAPTAEPYEPGEPVQPVQPVQQPGEPQRAVGALCAKCYRASPIWGTDPSIIEHELVKIGWAMEPVPSPVCPDCKQK